MYLYILLQKGDKNEYSVVILNLKKSWLFNLNLYPCKDNGYKDRNGMLVSKWLNRYNIEIRCSDVGILAKKK
ncbi:hypothetical protein GCM10022289_11900 [Pedobacter jeongneungensis]|uniref:Uncharacterized protein n=1 Tax=Pedobacter jeongneungensis TaxID=947309 RepID=A0ABP8B8L2_9SPHI